MTDPSDVVPEQAGIQGAEGGALDSRLRGNDARRSGRDEGIGGTEGALDSSDLLKGRKAIAIRHNGETYRLQATRQGKLILTK